jgi:hypothetical protein
VEGYSVGLWTEFKDCISGGAACFAFFLIVVFLANRQQTRLRIHINTWRCGPPTWPSHQASSLCLGRVPEYGGAHREEV